MLTKNAILNDPARSRLDCYIYDAPLAYRNDYLAPAVIICPGGGFIELSPREAEPVALSYFAEGCAAFVVHYPVGESGAEFPKGLLALAAAVAHVREHADEYHINPARISVCGFSAGGHIAASLACEWNREEIYGTLNTQAGNIKPNAAIICYAVIDLEQQYHYPQDDFRGRIQKETESMFRRLLGNGPRHAAQKDSAALQKQVTPSTSPCFIWHTVDDKTVHVMNSIVFAEALAKNGVPFDLHIYRTGLHGLALANGITQTRPGDVNRTCAEWIARSKEWLNALYP
ncbi:MAG: alpha/beta hydrolase [Treponema sp.]|jgi:acetyl esterase/lipase|nr:alpha/beta hydrolase [Treponema sp.]